MKSIEPKRQFLASPEAAEFADALSKPIVRQAIEVALQQFVMNQVLSGDMTAAAASAIALEGAKRYVTTLLNLTEPDQTPAPDTSGKLKWPTRPQPHNQPLTRPKPGQPQ